MSGAGVHRLGDGRVGETSTVVSFTVYGIAAGKGSTTSRFVPGKGRTFTHSPTSTKDWESLVKVVAQDHSPPGGLLEGPLQLQLRFFLPKPKSAPKRRRTWPDKKPDLDKLIRAVGDALTGVLYTDDARIVAITASKDYDVTPRVEIELGTVEEGDHARDGVLAWPVPG